MDVAALRRQPGVTRAVAIDEVVAADDAGLDADVRISGEIRAAVEQGRLRVIATLTVDTTVTCSRCLVLFPLRVPVAFEEMFGFGAPRTASGELGQEHFIATVGDTLDAGDLARQHALLELPERPLCRPDCQGLCPVCGVNRNETPCRCAANEGDPRLAPLKSIRIQP